ncbi:MAG: hypothetical protein IJN99_03800 [Clostridia bacterium]|nr:hypothetical protein [Clostridia bacterium]
METNTQSNNISLTPASPVRLAQWVTEKMLSRTTVTLQGMMYNNNLLPEQVENLYLVYMQEQNAYSRIRNIAELYGEPDSVSSLMLATYNPEQYLNALVRHILKLTAGHSIEIIVNCDSTLKGTVFDLRRTNLILYNLISNAIIHNNYKQKVITVRAFKRDKDFVISVKDNGRGISPSVRKTMFSAYENKPDLKTYSSADNSFELKGLGLSVCKKAATEMNGSIAYVPSRFGGAEFELIIPQNQKITFSCDTLIPEIDISEAEICLAGAILFLKSQAE